MFFTQYFDVSPKKSMLFLIKPTTNDAAKPFGGGLLKMPIEGKKLYPLSNKGRKKSQITYKMPPNFQLIRNFSKYFTWPTPRSPSKYSKGDSFSNVNDI